MTRFGCAWLAAKKRAPMTTVQNFLTHRNAVVFRDIFPTFDFDVVSAFWNLLVHQFPVKRNPIKNRIF